MAKAKVLKFYFDFLSPYSYLAFQNCRNLIQKYPQRVAPALKPVFLPALLKIWGQKGPAEIPHKRKAMYHDLLRYSKFHRLPFCIPPRHPFNPLLPLRLSLCLEGEDRILLCSEFFDYCWGKGLDISDTGVAIQVLEKCRFDHKKMIKLADSREVKDLLKMETEKAAEAGVFGVPTMILDGELFWGNDQFVYLERSFQGDPVIDPEEMFRWDERIEKAYSLSGLGSTK
eukprot:TRINITY_DN9783_c0_g1_i1.p1 TRINITY_DN9783_c0_g1~~TRINITY_DN9783_c0_g1_i1.p1  ORF type:complete len:228 (-),score=32.86 TRINITY_DN9783_c0_g1_i1:89-772(-)